LSKFYIYQINHFDPNLFGRRKRRLTLLFAAIYPLFMLSFQIAVNFLNIKANLLLIISLPICLALYFYLIFKIKSGLKQIKTIGDIEFTRHSIKKRIGDSFAEYDFRTIEKLELHKYLPDATSGNNNRYFSYILKIIFINSYAESIVVSDKPEDKRQNLSIVDTMKTLKKLIQPEIIIKL